MNERPRPRDGARGADRRPEPPGAPRGWPEAAKAAVVRPWLLPAGRRGLASGVLLEVMFIGLTLVFFLGVTKKWALVKAPAEASLSEGEQGPATPSRPGRVNLLFMGIDSVEGTHRTDTMFLLGIAPQERQVSILSIPRDTRVVVNGVGRKINEVLPRFGEYVLRSMIEALMEIRINRAVKVDFQGFVRILDLMGGVDLEIEQAMHYDDNWGKVHIHFDKGPAHLDGQKALEFVRFRADASADLGRIKRQQRFLAALLAKLQTPAMMVRLPMLIAEGLAHVQTDLTLAEALEIVGGLRGGQVSIQTMSLPGDARYVDKVSFFMPFKDQAVSLGARHFANLLVLELDASFTPGLSSPTDNTRPAPAGPAPAPMASGADPAAVASGAAPGRASAEAASGTTGPPGPPVEASGPIGPAPAVPP